MCKACELRQADPRWRAFQPYAWLELLTVTEAAKLLADKTAYLSWSYMADRSVAEVKAAALAITDDTVQAAHTREMLRCLN